MIQDIYPSRLDNSYAVRTPGDSDDLLVFDDEGNILSLREEGRIGFIKAAQIPDAECIYLFSIDDTGYFLLKSPLASVPEGYGFCSVRKLRDETSGKELFAAFTGYHLWKWYSDNKYCGACAGELVPDDKERALRCTVCQKVIYPRINPAVIVGVTNGDRLLITRYRRGYSHYALIAGFAEIGETLEETVAREVKEETGVSVTNIRYYKSQPWGIAQDLLVGYYCDVTGDDSITMDEGELRFAQWVKREDIELQPQSSSLTNEMMRMFKEGRV